MMTNVNESVKSTDSPFTVQEAEALEALKIRYQTDHDLFSPQEVERLRFLRWRISKGSANQGAAADS